MAFRLCKKPTPGLLSLAKKPTTSGLQIRTFANVETNAPPQVPQPRQRQTPVSPDTGNFTIRVRTLEYD